jgi:hypothetical protein
MLLPELTTRTGLTSARVEASLRRLVGAGAGSSPGAPSTRPASRPPRAWMRLPRRFAGSAVLAFESRSAPVSRLDGRGAGLVAGRTVRQRAGRLLRLGEPVLRFGTPDRVAGGQQRSAGPGSCLDGPAAAGRTVWGVRRGHPAWWASPSTSDVSELRSRHDTTPLIVGDHPHVRRPSRPSRRPGRARHHDHAVRAVPRSSRVVGPEHPGRRRHPGRQGH